MRPCPLWMTRAVQARPCPSCRRPMRPEDIVGLVFRMVHARPDSPAATVGPITNVITHCRCGKTHGWLAAVPRQAAKEGVDRIFDMSPSARKEERTCDGTCGASSSDEDRSPASPPWKGRRPPVPHPSRGACPKTPIGDREVERFLRQLGRTSFRRASKGFAEFMTRLGYRIDGAPVEPPLQADEDDDTPPF